ncbi:MAG: molybdenum ABC transporter ATP-binding protein [Acidobacteriota bacterium]
MSPLVDLDLVVPCGRFDVALAWRTDEPALGLFGPSGAGKTSVLEAIAGLRREARGRIEVAGEVWLDSSRGVRLQPEARGVGYVPQEALLFPHLDVAGNLALGTRRARSSRRRIAIERILAVLELGPLARVDVATLSGGERRRVALGRALASAPDLLLLDEPLAGLDLALRRRILPYLLRVREEFATPMLFVSHDASETTLLAREVSVLEGGRVVGRGRPEELFAGHALATPAEGAAVTNVLGGRVVAVDESLAEVELGPGLAVAIADDGGCAPGQRVAFELRGGDVLLALGPAAGLSAQNVLPATIRAVHAPPDEDLHSAVVVSAELAGGPALTVVVSRRASRELALAPGREVHLVFKAQACRLLAAW